MAITKELLAARVGAKDPDDCIHALATAHELLDEALVDRFREVPEYTFDEMVLSVGYAVYERKKSSDGKRSLTTVEGQTSVQAPRDPLASVRSILANYVVGMA